MLVQVVGVFVRARVHAQQYAAILDEIDALLGGELAGLVGVEGGAGNGGRGGGLDGGFGEWARGVCGREVSCVVNEGYRKDEGGGEEERGSHGRGETGGGGDLRRGLGGWQRVRVRRGIGRGGRDENLDKSTLLKHPPYFPCLPSHVHGWVLRHTNQSGTEDFLNEGKTWGGDPLFQGPAGDISPGMDSMALPSPAPNQCILANPALAPFGMCVMGCALDSAIIRRSLGSAILSASAIPVRPGIIPTPPIHE